MLWQQGRNDHNKTQSGYLKCMPFLFFTKTLVFNKATYFNQRRDYTGKSILLDANFWFR